MLCSLAEDAAAHSQHLGSCCLQSNATCPAGMCSCVPIIMKPFSSNRERTARRRNKTPVLCSCGQTASSVLPHHRVGILLLFLVSAGKAGPETTSDKVLLWESLGIIATVKY